MKETTTSPYNIEISLPNDLTEQQAINLETLAAPYGGVIITADKITFPSLLQSLPQPLNSTDLSYIAIRLVNEAKGRTQSVPFPDKATVEELCRKCHNTISVLVRDGMVAVYELDEHGEDAMRGRVAVYHEKVGKAIRNN